LATTSLIPFPKAAYPLLADREGDSSFSHNATTIKVGKKNAIRSIIEVKIYDLHNIQSLLTQKLTITSKNLEHTVKNPQKYD
jgi:hypothetical protein